MADGTDSTTAASAAPAAPPTGAPATDTASIQAAQSAASAAAPADEPDGTYADDNYSREQLITHARTLLGAEPFIAEVALRHAGGAEFFTIEEAKAAVQELLQSTGGE